MFTYSFPFFAAVQGDTFDVQLQTLHKSSLIYAASSSNSKSNNKDQMLEMVFQYSFTAFITLTMRMRRTR